MVKVVSTELLGLGRLRMGKIFMKLTLVTVVRKGLSSLLALLLKTKFCIRYRKKREYSSSPYHLTLL